MSFRAERSAKMRSASCDGKVTFQSFAAAERAAHKSARTKKARLSPYPCPNCHRFHVGNSLQRKDASGHGIDPRQAYCIYGTGPDGRELLIGYSNEPDGGAVARRLIDVPGWAVTRVVTRYSKSA